ncbi:MAG: gamma-glutamyltransferase, partial [Planctomycetales bacterium]|nr:gamma-glutamyltransferase [Planctomycetales bacterium]
MPPMPPMPLRRVVFVCVLWVCVALTSLRAEELRSFSAQGRRGAIASVHPLATQAGLKALQDGGNAVDAAIATAVTLGVVDGHNSGLGGGCFVLIRSPEGETIAIDGREMAPGAATADMYLRDGKAVAELSQTGPLAVAVPGAIAAYEMAARKCGRKPLSRALDEAAQLAAAGFPIDRVMARNIREHRDEIARFPATAAVLFKANGMPLVEGDRLVQADLAHTYRQLAEQGSAALYRGAIGKQIAAWMAANGGLITEIDLANYVALEREPLVTTYRGHTIVGFPPPSSGGVHVGQILNILEEFDLQELQQRDPALLVHVVAEAMKLAFADRAYWLGDSDFVPVPRGLVDTEYAKQLAQRIQLDRTTAVDDHGWPPEWDSRHFKKHTTHIAAVDEQGWWVAITTTVNTSFGSKVIVPGTGLVLNNEMDDFSAQPGMPNA